MSLGIECGASCSKAILVPSLQGSWSESESSTFKFPGLNYLLNSRTHLESGIQALKSQIELGGNGGGLEIQRIGLGMAGVVDSEAKIILKEILKGIWPTAKEIWVGDDLATALACLEIQESPRSNKIHHHIKAIVISGTGSFCFGLNPNSNESMGVDGCGHVLGDRGSGYGIASEALRACVRETQRSRTPPKLLTSILQNLDLKSIEELIGWSLGASKSKIASLAPVVLEGWRTGDQEAQRVIEYTVQELVGDMTSIIQFLLKNCEMTSATVTVHLGLTGSLLTEVPEFRGLFLQTLRKGFPLTLQINPQILRDTCRGALNLLGLRSPASQIQDENLNRVEDMTPNREEAEKRLRAQVLPIKTALSPTESRNPRSTNLDSMSIPEIITLWLREEASVFEPISTLKDELESLVLRVGSAFLNGGRLFYVGSGTSGRLGLLDASECPPTFSAPPHWVQGIVAGGDTMTGGNESAEDWVLDGIQAMDDYGITPNDIVMGIASSGTTPFVWGSLYRGSQLGAFTTFLTFNPNLTLTHVPDQVLTLDLGPEILTGSTRLKCGTATKVILNLITTAAMVKIGKCLGNLMVDLMPVNEKLRERALRIVVTILKERGISGQMEEKELGDLVSRTLENNLHDIKKSVIELDGILKQSGKQPKI